MAVVLDGRETSAKIMEELTAQIEELKGKGVNPALALVLTGTDRFSRRYVRMKARRAEETGIEAQLHHLEETTTEEVVALVSELSKNPKVHGVLVQLPVAEGLEELEIVSAIDPEKDVDGLTPTTLGKMLLGEETLLPAGVEAIIELFRRYDLDPQGKHWVVAGSTNWLGKPLLALLANMDVRVTSFGKDEPRLAEYVKDADVLCTELFSKHAVTAEMVKEGVIVIDNGNNYEGKKVYGDVDTEAVSEKAGAITPVPGGVGPLLIAMLLHNTVKAASRSSV
ncbi:MAG: bifunctional 5,10-methylenetetrahydrofolate dehydrogenase/5,10-methenyltetrahydrofolate cyclohydrolase [Candidatus Bathyarchaeota archaeon]|nr:MAG: bifunctional 5,10-methylenetetrahydrofolate dehydrogenase/5,10-methenyltetrahydrofolate cyclohydrolase [Candidatus Bathyarchaeota archaeon]